MGAGFGALGWLFVGMFLARRAARRAARDAARVVYFELVGNHLAVFTALQFGAFGSLTRTSFDRLMPELAAWLEIEELQTVALAYIGHAGFEQAARETDTPPEVRRRALSGLHEAHRSAVAILRSRAFTPAEVRRLAAFATPDQLRLLEAADAAAGDAAIHGEPARARP